MQIISHSNTSDWTLSDPFGDFCYDEQSLQLIAAKRGAGLTVEELAFTVFAGYLPAGTYEECIPYLPAAYDYLRTATPGADDGLPDLWENLFHIWVPENIENLRRDGLLEGVVAQMRGIFHERLESWLRTGESIAMAANLELWCMNFLCSRLVAEDHAPLLQKLRTGGVHARILLLQLHPASTPSFPHMSPDNEACYFTPSEVRSTVQQCLPETLLPEFLRTLRTDAQTLFESRKATHKLMEYWDIQIRYAEKHVTK